MSSLMANNTTLKNIFDLSRDIRKESPNRNKSNWKLLCFASSTFQISKYAWWKLFQVRNQKPMSVRTDIRTSVKQDTLPKVLICVFPIDIYTISLFYSMKFNSLPGSKYKNSTR